MMQTAVKYSIDVIRDEARHLVGDHAVGRNQPIYTLAQFIPAREWTTVELELELNGFLLRDRVSDLLGREDWDDD